MYAYWFVSTLDKHQTQLRLAKKIFFTKNTVICLTLCLIRLQTWNSKKKKKTKNKFSMCSPALKICKQAATLYISEAHKRELELDETQLSWNIWVQRSMQLSQKALWALFPLHAVSWGKRKLEALTFQILVRTGRLPATVPLCCT